MEGLDALRGEIATSPIDHELDFRVLGTVEVHRNGASVAMGGTKQRSVLALLVANVGHPVSLDRIVVEIYGDDAGAGTRRSVQTFISTIRREVGDIIGKQGAGYVLDVEPSSVDAVRFVEQVRAGTTTLEHDPELASDSLREALSMWRGHPYSNVDASMAFDAEIVRLTELRLTALEARIDADMALGRHGELVAELGSLTVEHPLRERLRAQQMLALFRAGRQTEALRAYERTRVYLNDEVGIDPSPELQQLEQQILAHDPALDLPVTPSVMQRVVMVVEVADPHSLLGLDPAARTEMVAQVSETVAALVERHGGEGFAQRGSTVYAAFTRLGDAVAAIRESTTGSRVQSRIAVDYGAVEVHDSGDVTGPPIRRAAGLVAAAHPGQVLVSADAHRELTALGDPGWQIKSLGAHRIYGVDKTQPVFQLILADRKNSFPPLRIDASPLPLPVDRRAVSGYELRRPISSDLSGTSYRAYQPSVGREGIVTVIDPVWANQPGFVQRFEVEAHLVTRMQHPHIVPVLDYWRDPTGAYLVMSDVAPVALANTLDGGRLGERDRIRVVEQVAAALSYAHELGAVHGMISPDTVVLDDSNNAYLTGAGFVLRLAGAPLPVSSYTPPEVGQGGPLGVATDVYGLGVLISELIDTDGLADIAARATTANPGDRFPSVAVLMSEVGKAVGRVETWEPYSERRNPYKGLEAFGETDAGDFHGRTELVGDLVAAVKAHRLVAVVGPSGSGKSSLVKAGLVPAVRDGVLGGPQQPVVTDMFPGSFPFEELEAALARVATTDPGSVVAAVDGDDHGLVRVIKRILPADTRLVLVIDQFEELFTMTQDDAVRRRFLAALCGLAADERSEARIVLTLRADFFDRPLEHPEFGTFLTRAVFPITTPSADQLTDSVRLPAEAVGLSWEPGLVEDIVADVEDAPGTLPLLQYALTELVASRTSDRLGHDRYRATGGVLGALGARADEVFEHLDARRQRLARQVWLRLVTIQQSGEETRRRARLPELNAVVDSADVSAILTAFGDARLLTFDRDPVTRMPVVEVAHEALLARWPRLAEWISEAREGLLLRQRLTDAAHEWDQRGRDDAYLLTGGRLAQFQAWFSATDLALAGTDTEFLDLSGRRSQQQQDRRRRVRRLVTSGFAAVAVVATVLGIAAYISRQTAAENAELARSRELAASAVNLADDDPELSLLLALEAAAIAEPPVEAISSLHEALAAHRKILTYSWPSDRPIDDLAARLSPDGHRMISSGGRSYVEMIDVDSGEQLWDLELPGDGIAWAAFTPDGSQIAVSYGWAPTADQLEPGSQTTAALGVHLLDASTGDLVRFLPMGPCGLVTLPEIEVVGTAPTFSLLAAAPQESECRFDPNDFLYRNAPPAALIDLGTGDIEIVGPLSIDMAMTADGDHLILSDANAVNFNRGESRVIDRTGGEEVVTLQGLAVDISNDGAMAATRLPDGILLWDLAEGQPDEPVASIGETFDAWFAPAGDGLWTVPSFRDPTVQLRDSRTGDRLDTLLTGLGSNGLVSQSADGTRVVVNERADTAAVFDLDDPAEVASQQLCQHFHGQFLTFDVGDDTLSFRTGCGDRLEPTQFVLERKTLEPLRSIDWTGGARTALSLDGGKLASQLIDPDGFLETVVVEDPLDGSLQALMDGLCRWREGDRPGPECNELPETPFNEWLWDLDFSPDGSLLAMSGQYSGEVVVWDTETGAIVAVPQVPRDPDSRRQAADVEFSPDGQYLLSSYIIEDELWLISTADWEPVAQYDTRTSELSNTAPVTSFVFTPDGRTLIGTDFGEFGEGRITFMDGRTLKRLGSIDTAHNGGVFDLAISGDGKLMASAGADGVARVWDVESRSLVHQVPLSDDGAMGAVEFTDDGNLIVANMATGVLEVVAIDTDMLLDIARSRVRRTFTDTECDTYRIDPCPTLEDLAPPSK